MKRQSSHSHKEFIIGAAVGSLLGGVAALLTAPKSGKKIRQDICDTYCDLSKRTQELAHKGKNLANSFGSHHESWADKAKHLFSKEEEESMGKDFLIGGLAGGVLGAVAGLLLAPKSGEELREDIMETYDDVSEYAHDVAKRGKGFAKSSQKRANKWLNLAREVVDEFAEDTHDKTEEFVENAKEFIDHRMHDVMDWASIGVRLWKVLKSK